MSHQTEKKSKMENPSSAPLPPRPPLPGSLERQPSFDEHGPKTLSARDLKLAREEALKIFSTHTKEEATKIFMEKKVTNSKKANVAGCLTGDEE